MADGTVRVEGGDGTGTSVEARIPLATARAVAGK